MSEITLKRLSKKDYEKAQYLYFAGQTVEDICTAMTLDSETLRYYIFGEDGNGTDKSSWFSLKKKMNPTAMSLYLKDKVGILDQTAGVALDILTMSLGRLREEMINDTSMRLNLDEMSKLATIQVNLDKVARLESGKATEIMDHMGMTLSEAKEILDADPFAQEIKVEFKEVPWIADNKQVDEEI